MQVVFPGDADATVHLHASLNDLARHLTDIGLGDAGRQARSRRAGGDIGDRSGRRRAAGFQPHLHIGEPVFECLVGRQGPAECVPIERPLDSEVEHRLQDADHLGALQHLRDLALPVDQRRSLGGSADRRGRLHDHTVEVHPRIVLDQVDGLLCHDPDAGRVRRNQKLPNLVTASRHHQQHRTLGARLDTVFDAIDAVAGVGERRGHRRLLRRPPAARLGNRPRRHRFTRHQRFDGGDVRLPDRRSQPVPTGQR